MFTQSLFLFFISLSAFGAKIVPTIAFDQLWESANEKKLSQTLKWRKLLHFEPGLFGTLSSQVEPSKFFLSPQGDVNMEAELRADLAAFLKDSPDQEPDDRMQCRFPARFRWLKAELAPLSDIFPVVDCPRFQKFRDGLAGQSLSLVFSSYYLNNPSSTFGHTFIRINKAPDAQGERFELLDYGINYSATLDTSNALVYSFRGLFGLFAGVFTSVPYYLKVREYNNVDSRDLWEYELNFTQAEVDDFIAHSWEMGSALLRYWYLTQNCSYHMFTILEATKPEIHILERLKKYVIPTDTVLAIWDSGLVKSVHYRPSIRTKFSFRVDQLGKNEKNNLADTLKTQSIPIAVKSLPAESRAKILDAAMDGEDFREFANIQDPTSKAAEFKSELLLERSHLSEKTLPFNREVAPEDMPQFAHPSKRADLGYRRSDIEGDQLVFNYKFAMHDRLDPFRGYPDYAHIDFFTLQTSYAEKIKRFRLDNWSLFEVTSTSPWTRFFPAVSWEVKLGIERLRSENCDGCTMGVFKVGAGYTYAPSMTSPFSASLGVRGGAYLQTVFSNEFVGAGPAASVRYRFSRDLIALYEGWYRYDYNQNQTQFFENSLSTQWSFAKVWGLRAGYHDYVFDREAFVTGVYYF